MASLKRTLAKAISGNLSRESNTGNDQEALQVTGEDKYLLQVSAGPSYDTKTHQIIIVNGNDASTFENAFMRAKVRVRIRGFTGLPRNAPRDSQYFSDPLHKNDQYSISFGFIPKVNLPSQDVVWGNDFDHPVRDRLPPGFNTAFKIVKQFIDPGLECDAYADQPWLLGPALSCWFEFHVGEIGQRFEVPEVVEEGAHGSGKEIRIAKGLPEASEKRRKHFLNEANRQVFEFEQGRLYSGDFHNPYLDFGNFSLKLPGFSLNVLKHIDDKSHTLRYVFKNKATGDVYFVVLFRLLFGDELKRALAAEQTYH